MRKLITFALLLTLSTVANATNGGCNSRGCEQPSNEQKQSQSADATAVAGAIAVSGASASADNKNSVSNRNDVDVNTSDYNANLNVNDNTNVAYGGKGGKGGDGGDAVQGQSQYSDNSNSSNNSSSQSTSLTFESTGEAEHYNKYGNNVSAFAPAIYSSSACTAGGLSGGAAAMGMGISLGGAKQDPQCQVRENARILAGINPGLALEYLCKNDKVDIGATLGAQCKPAVAPPVVVVPPPVVAPPIQVVTEDVKGK